MNFLLWISAGVGGADLHKRDGKWDGISDSFTFFRFDLADFQNDNQTGFGYFVFTSDSHPKKSVWGLSMEWVSREAGVEWDFNGGKLDKSGWLSLFS